MRDSSYLQLQSWKSAVCYTTWTITNKKSTPKVPVYFIPDRCCDWTSGASELLIFRQKVHKEWVWCAETSPSLSTKHHDISCWQWLHRNDKQYTNRSLSQSCKAWITYLWQTVGGHGLSNDPNTEYTHLVLTANLCQYRQSSATWQRNWPSTSNLCCQIIHFYVKPEWFLNISNCTAVGKSPKFHIFSLSSTTSYFKAV